MRTLNFKTQLLVASPLSIDISTTNKLLQTTMTTRKNKTGADKVGVQPPITADKPDFMTPFS